MPIDFQDFRDDADRLWKPSGEEMVVGQLVTSSCPSARDDVRGPQQPVAGRSSLSASAVVSGPLPGDGGERPTLRSKQTGEQSPRLPESMSSIMTCVCLSVCVSA